MRTGDGSGESRSASIGSSPTSFKWSWSLPPTTCGTTAPSIIFFTAAADRSAYIRRVANSVKRGGHVIVSTFGPDGPTRCSGLDVVRYDAESLHREFGVHFRMLGSSTELHHTPFGTIQQFLYCYCRVE